MCGQTGFKEFFPKFTWVFRDFELGFKHLDAASYLEQTLEEERGVSEEIVSRNKVKRQLKGFFPTVDCI